MYCHSIFFVSCFVSPTKPFECVMTNTFQYLFSFPQFAMSENYWVAIHLLLQLYRLTVCVRHLQANDVLYNQLENVLIHKNILMEKIYWIEMIFFLYSIKMSSKYFFILNYFYISIYDIFPHRGLPYIPITWAFLDLKKKLFRNFN